VQVTVAKVAIRHIEKGLSGEELAMLIRHCCPDEAVVHCLGDVPSLRHASLQRALALMPPGAWVRVHGVLSSLLGALIKPGKWRVVQGRSARRYLRRSRHPVKRVAYTQLNKRVGTPVVSARASRSVVGCIGGGLRR